MSSLEAVYDMTWAEFQIRLFAYKRQDKYDWIKQRELMWTIYTAPHQDPKKMIKSKQKFLPIEKESNNTNRGISDEMRQRFIGEYQKYIDKVKQKQ